MNLKDVYQISANIRLAFKIRQKMSAALEGIAADFTVQNVQRRGLYIITCGIADSFAVASYHPGSSCGFISLVDGVGGLKALISMFRL